MTLQARTKELAQMLQRRRAERGEGLGPVEPALTAQTVPPAFPSEPARANVTPRANAAEPAAAPAEPDLRDVTPPPEACGRADPREAMPTAPARAVKPAVAPRHDAEPALATKLARTSAAARDDYRPGSKVPSVARADGQLNEADVPAAIERIDFKPGSKVPPMARGAAPADTGPAESAAAPKSAPAPAADGTNNRRSRRRSTTLPAAMAFPNMRVQVPCIVVDMSGTGAKLELPASSIKQYGEADHLPNRMTLILKADRLQIDAEVKWRRSGKFGVRFLGPPKPLETAKR